MRKCQVSFKFFQHSLMSHFTRRKTSLDHDIWLFDCIYLFVLCEMGYEFVLSVMIFEEQTHSTCLVLWNEHGHSFTVLPFFEQKILYIFSCYGSSKKYSDNQGKKCFFTLFLLLELEFYLFSLMFLHNNLWIFKNVTYNWE